MNEENVLQPLLVTSNALHMATETVVMIMKIDDLVFTR
jgi:T-complex protein 1 subunit delta